MQLASFEKRFDEIVSSYSHDAGKAIEYCSDENGEAFKVMRTASENAMQDIKILLLQYLNELH